MGLFDSYIIEEPSAETIIAKTKSTSKPKAIVSAKSLKSKSVPIEDKLRYIEKEVTRILGTYAENTVVITDYNEFEKYIDESIENGIIAVDTETNNSLDPLTCKLMGLCIYTPNNKHAYIPVNHTDLFGNKLENQITEEQIRVQLSRLPDVKILMHNAKFDIEVIKCTCGIQLNCYWDTSLACRLLDENEQAGLKWQYINKVDPSIEKYDIEHLFTIEYNYVSPELFALYAATDAYMTYRLYLYQLTQMNNPDNSKIYKLFMEVEMPLVEVLVSMELKGICIDEEYFDRLHVKYHNLYDEYEKQLNVELSNLSNTISEWRMTKEANEHPIGKDGKQKKSKSEQLSNPPQLNSPTQLAILLYDVLKLPSVDKDSPRGTGADILEQLDHPICKIMTEQKTVSKLLDAFIDVLPGMRNPSDMRIHASFNQLAARTGRQSCSNPNLQQVPSKNSEIRLGFVAKEGYTFVGADFSQQEPRLASFLSGDPNMIKAYQEGRDLYATMGTGVWHNDYWDNMEHYEDGSPNVEGKKRRSLCKKLLLGKLMYVMPL